MLINCVSKKYFWWVRLSKVCYINQSTKHVVPLRWAWEQGAHDWSEQKREQFANDPRNLWSVELSLNRSKGVKGPNEWLPPAGRCQYISRFLPVVKIYGLDATSSPFERAD
jgi:hypothetical protein